MSVKQFEREEVKYYKKGMIFMIGNMSDYGVSETEMNIREAVLEKEGYYVHNPMKIIPYNSSEKLRNRILIARLMECNTVYLMLGYGKTPVNNLLMDLIINLNYNIIYEKNESTEA